MTSAWKSLAVCGSLPVSNIVKVSVKQYVTVDKLSKLAGVVMLLTHIWAMPTSNLDQVSHPEFVCGFYQSVQADSWKLFKLAHEHFLPQYSCKIYKSDDGTLVEILYVCTLSIII